MLCANPAWRGNRKPWSANGTEKREASRSACVCGRTRDHQDGAAGCLAPRPHPRPEPCSPGSCVCHASASLPACRHHYLQETLGEGSLVTCWGTRLLRPPPQRHTAHQRSAGVQPNPRTKDLSPVLSNT